MRFVVRFLTVLVAIIFPNWVCTTKMENYFDLDWQLMTELKSYSEDLQGHISVLNRYIDDRKSELAKVGNDREKYLGNPINSYSLLHHLHFDWPIWRKLMVRPLATEQVGEMRELLSKIPTKDEYMDSIKEAIDFQKQEDDYVNSNEGIIGQESEVLEEGALFSPMESLEIAQYAYDQENYEQAEDWLNTTLNGYKNLDHEEREVYKVIMPVSESQVQDLYEKVKKINRRLR